MTIERNGTTAWPPAAAAWPTTVEEFVSYSMATSVPKLMYFSRPGFGPAARSMISSKFVVPVTAVLLVNAKTSEGVWLEMLFDAENA